MTKATTIGAVVAIAIGVALVTTGTLLFRGYFDPGLFEVKSTQWSHSKQVAIVAERSDHQAMNGDVYFVLIGDHVLSPSELRRAYHSAKVIFGANRDCLTVNWQLSSTLVVTCRDSSIGIGNIETQRHRSDGVDISYVNIPTMDRQ